MLDDIKVFEGHDDGVFSFSIDFDLMKNPVDAFSIFIDKLKEIKKSNNFDKFIEPPDFYPFLNELCNYNDCIYRATMIRGMCDFGMKLTLMMCWKEKSGE